MISKKKRKVNILKLVFSLVFVNALYLMVEENGIL